MKKVKLFRKGRFVGLVKEDFHNIHHQEQDNSMWEQLGLSKIY
jgi:hypothetical protein